MKSAWDDKLLYQVHSELRQAEQTTSQTPPPDARMRTKEQDDSLTKFKELLIDSPALAY